MNDITTTPAPVQRREPIKFSWWDHLMKFSDIGIAAWAMLMYAFLYIPIVVLIIYSFNSQRLNVTWEGFTTKWYWMTQDKDGVGVIHDVEVIEVPNLESFLIGLLVGTFLILGFSIFFRKSEEGSVPVRRLVVLVLAEALVVVLAGVFFQIAANFDKYTVGLVDNIKEFGSAVGKALPEIASFDEPFSTVLAIGGGAIGAALVIMAVTVGVVALVIWITSLSKGKVGYRKLLPYSGTISLILGIAFISYEMFVGAKGAFPTSIQIALLSTLIAVIIGTLGSFALVRFEFRTKQVWDGLNYTKIIIAEVVAGVSTLLFFVQLENWLSKYLGIEGLFALGFNTVLIAHVAWNIPFVVVIIRARLAGFDKAYEEAGSDLGSTPVGVFFRITLPVIAPGIMAAGLLAFTLSFDDVITTLFTSGPQMNTLPILIWSKVRMGITPEINALSTFMVAFSMIVVAILELKAHISEDVI